MNTLQKATQARGTARLIIRLATRLRTEARALPGLGHVSEATKLIEQAQTIERELEALCDQLKGEAAV